RPDDAKAGGLASPRFRRPSPPRRSGRCFGSRSGRGRLAAARLARYRWGKRRTQMSDQSFRFSHAITRRPGASITAGLRAVDTGAPDLALMLRHHQDYVAALRETGASVVELDPLEAYPDSVFVEDTALCLPEGAIIM